MSATSVQASRRRTKTNATIECGWGQLYFAPSWGNDESMALALQAEKPGRRDIAIYVDSPQVHLSYAPQQLFLDPSVFYRLNLLQFEPTRTVPSAFHIRPANLNEDLCALNRLYATRGMVSIAPEFVQSLSRNTAIQHFVAVDTASETIMGCITGVDHVDAFNDNGNGSSFWCLAVDPQAPFPGVGCALVDVVAHYYKNKHRSYLDLSVMHDNSEAVSLYCKMGFIAVDGFALKRKNAINEALYSDPDRFSGLNSYARVIVNEALRRGIDASIVDKTHNLFALSLAGKEIYCRESLSDLTSATALQVCQDKMLTAATLKKQNLHVPDQLRAASLEANNAFLQRVKRLVVKPLNGEQGNGITVDVTTPDEMARAIALAHQFDQQVLLEKYYCGQELRIIVIGTEVVAAAVRKPAQIVGDGVHAIEELIKKQSRRRMAATCGESKIPLDDETRRCVAVQHHALTDVLPKGQQLNVRKTANLHTGGTLHDVTETIHPALKMAAIEAAKVLRIPVVGLDMLVPNIRSPEYVIIEANERPGLANHEPRPTAEKFIDLLFPSTIAA